MNNKYILYWMQQAQRVSNNNALSYATNLANKDNLQVLVVFCVTEKIKDGNIRHFQFMLEGLIETGNLLREKGYLFELIVGECPGSLDNYIKNSVQVVCDYGYLNFQRKWREEVKDLCNKHNKVCHIIETELIIPVEEASDKQEYMAWTFRKKIANKVENYLKITDLQILKNKALHSSHILSKETIKKIMNKLEIDKSVSLSKKFEGGYNSANEWLKLFLEKKIFSYGTSQSPEFEYFSLLSPYLHFGQISSLEITLKVLDVSKATEEKYSDNINNYLEQLIVRRELAFNYVYYNKKYDSFPHITSSWAYETMSKHATDIREHIYRMSDLEDSKTHDIYWNTAMEEMKLTGYMHNYMRMYWCKKIIEWTKTYQEAYEYAIHLNNKYFLDGRDPNSYTGVAWCFGLHDRAWKEREIFGKLRYMNRAGLERKFNMSKYIERVKDM